jgi:hypothetical protein
VGGWERWLYTLELRGYLYPRPRPPFFCGVLLLSRSSTHESSTTLLSMGCVICCWGWCECPCTCCCCGCWGPTLTPETPDAPCLCAPSAPDCLPCCPLSVTPSSPMSVSGLLSSSLSLSSSSVSNSGAAAATVASSCFLAAISLLRDQRPWVAAPRARTWATVSPWWPCMRAPWWSSCQVAGGKVE